MKMRIILIMMTLVCMATSAWAADYYMSPTGNDSNPGTLAAPWRTLDKLTQVRRSFSPGDTVYFRGGDYVITNANASYFVFGDAGTLARPIVYKNYNGEKPVIIYDRTTADNNSRTGSENMLFLHSYCVVDGLNFKQTESSRRQGVQVVGGPGRKTGVTVYGDGIIVRNCTIDNFSGLAFGYFGGSNLLVEHCSITNNGSHGFYISSRNGTYRYNYINGSRGYVAQYGVQMQYKESVGNKVYGNLVVNSKAGGVVFSGPNVNNEVFNNIIINGGDKPDGGYGYALTFWCILGRGPSTGNKFYNNTIIGKSNSGIIDTSTGAVGPWCNEGAPYAQRVAIFNNIFYPSGPTAATMRSLSSIRNNIFYNITGPVPAGNTLINPNLVNPNGTTAADAMLQAGSPAIDKATSGAPGLDYRSGVRPVGSAADIGAYEYGAPAGAGGGPVGGGSSSSGGGGSDPTTTPPCI